jgi:hypothetical protein
MPRGTAGPDSAASWKASAAAGNPTLVLRQSGSQSQSYGSAVENLCTADGKAAALVPRCLAVWGG